MRKLSKGFGLIEIMVALVLGLVISMGVIQIFVASRGTYTTQNTSARMQEDARFVLSKMMQEIRMTGMFGCLSVDNLVPANGSIVKPAAFNTPVSWNNANSSLTLITADIGGSGGAPDWTVISDCQSTTQLYAGKQPAGTGQVAFPLRQLTYVLTGTDLKVVAGTDLTKAQPLLSNVGALAIDFGMAGTPMTYFSGVVTAANAANIRSVRIRLTLTDPNGRVRDQVYNVVAAVRNRF
ncbi:type IV pilus assembly protein PilW [Paucimonas lemoignei]|nr:type IV pilus assembly protein PilW [Paucimonas lemoignei]